MLRSEGAKHSKSRYYGPKVSISLADIHLMSGCRPYIRLQAMCEQNQWPTLRLDGQTPAKDRLGLVEQFNAPRAARDSGQQPWVFLLSSKVRLVASSSLS